MAGLTPFCYRPGSGFLHGLDPRFKLLFLAMISLSSLKANLFALPVLSALIIMMFLHIDMPLKSAIKEIRYFFLVLLFILAARALATPGAPVVQFGVISVTREGLVDGMMVCWRLINIVMLSLLLVATTRPAEMKAAAQNLLRPFPFIPEKRVAVMMGLVMRFIPVILDQARETADAQRARGVENRKNPLYRFRKLVLPLFRRTFETADRLTLAMEARCYTDNRTDPVLSSKPADWISLIVVLLLCLLAVLFKF